MLKITADFFSGIPNPEWIVDGDDAEAVLKDLAQHRAAVASLDSGFQGLGNRGLIVEALSEHVSEDHGLPPIFKLANGGTQLESKGIEVADRLISAMLKDGAARHPAITNPLSPDDRGLSSLFFFNDYHAGRNHRPSAVCVRSNLVQSWLLE